MSNFTNGVVRVVRVVRFRNLLIYIGLPNYSPVIVE